MSEKSLQKRLIDEADQFDVLYKQFEERHRAWVDAGNPADPWLSMFDIAFEKSLEANEEIFKKITPDASHPNYAVFTAIRKLGLHELRVRGVTTSDAAIHEAYKLGAVDLLDIQRLEKILNDPSPRPPIVKGHEVDRSDAIFWRTLLEIFCRSFTPARGRRPWTLQNYIHLALDLHEILQTKLKNSWDPSKALHILETQVPYKDRYKGGPANAAVGEDRIEKLEKWIGPIDDRLTERVAARNPDAFLEVLAERNPKAERSDEGLKALVESLRTPTLDLSEQDN